MARGLKKSLFIQLTALTSAIMLFLLSAFVFTNRHIKREAERNTLELNDKVLSQIEKNVEDYDSIINHVATIFAYSPTIYKYFTQDSMSQVISMEDVSTVFSNIALLEKNISGVYLFDKNMKRLAGMGKGMEAFENAASNHLIKDEMEYSELFCLPNSNVPYYMVYFPVFNLESREYRNQIGMCVLIMKRDRFGEMLEDSRVTEHSEIYILDKDQEIAAMTGEYNFGSIEDDKLVSSDAYLVEARELEIGGWEVVSRIPRSELTEHVSKSKYFIGMAYLLALGLMASLMVFCYNKILIPIRKLDEFVTSAAMNPKMRMCVDREDEIGTVSKSMNEMLDDIESMNEKIRTAQERALKAEVSEKQLQVLAYQNQINPHFLYNTFDCIRAMALYYDVEEIAEITMALSKVCLLYTSPSPRD